MYRQGGRNRTVAGLFAVYMALQDSRIRVSISPFEQTQRHTRDLWMRRELI